MTGQAQSRFDGMEEPDVLEREQRRLASSSPPPWAPGTSSIVAAGAFVAFARGQQGPGHAGDHAFVGAAATLDSTLLSTVVVERRAGASYRPGHLAAREGAMLEDAVRQLMASGPTLDVLLVDATGLDHPRGAGLALHLGAVLDLPTVGVTHRPLLATGPEPPDAIGTSTDLTLDGVAVGRWLRTQPHVRPLAVHAAWRTNPDVAVDVVRRVTAAARTPEPLRQARVVARTARAEQLHR